MRDIDASALDSTDRAIVDFAAKIARYADQVTASDIDDLRAVGLSDEEVSDVVLAAAIRCFFSKILDATGTLPDHQYMALDIELRDALTVGRPIAAPQQRAAEVHPPRAPTQQAGPRPGRPAGQAPRP